MARVREYEAFDAVKYVNDLISQTKVKETPKTWKGSRLPKPVIEQLIEELLIKKKKREEHLLRIEEIKKKLNLP